MDRKQFVEDNCIEEDVLFLDPAEEFDGGIIGVTEDKCHLVYSYEKLTCHMADVWFKEKKQDDERTWEDCLREACEWVDYNTLRSLPYQNQERVPIIIIESIDLDVPEENLSFGQAIEALKAGKRVARKGWNGKGIYLELQVPDEYSKMTLPYIYIVTTNLQTDNPAAPKGCVPWLASQTDMLSQDWYIVLDKY